MSADHVLYRFYSITDELLYIGITAYPMARFRDHQRNKEWWPDVAHIKVANYRSRSELLAAERGAIQAERPRYNVVHNGQADDAAPEQAGATYSLAEVAAAYLPPEWVGAERWLRDRLNRGEISGYRLGRVWRMTEDDVADFIASRRNAAVEAPAPQAPASSAIIDGLSQRSRRSLRVSA